MGSTLHIELNLLFVHPSHCRHGVGRMLIDWGIKKADELEIEVVVVSVPFAVPVYSRSGFVCDAWIEVDVIVEETSEQWKEWAGEDLRAVLMRKPARRVTSGLMNDRPEDRDRVEECDVREVDCMASGNVNDA
ncbi:hypothetical protein K458DRAFT_61488 [Lentithecium fluviatile CBS 122367]|uniref:N-acetyltransferase domain-containing protein n=1 Tax=Lentithecium fluviatile CBS 122367 TaxID=1168545 RepID=A0A6G1JJR3_9PLEO|nr:hypothetical protein K458DRAFT_61488 [Lentithecium fluviatile CBS 122367]